MGQLVHRDSSNEVKIALFRSLFRGRDDLYATRFENSKTGYSGYVPACDHEWIRGLCEKPRVKCAACSHQRFRPVTDEVLCWHLCGQTPDGEAFAMGIYPMRLDEQCYFLAIDFERQHWVQDIQSVLETCQRLQLSAAAERRCSGVGGRLWLFFAEAIPAVLARKLGSSILTEAMERRPGLGLDLYERFFPSQDTLVRGGFGSLVPLPLQKRPRMVGNSLFLDPQGIPYADQWRFLSTLGRIDRATAERIIDARDNHGGVLGIRLVTTDAEAGAAAEFSFKSAQQPVACGEFPIPKSVKLVLTNQIQIEKGALSPGLQDRLIRLAAFQNHEFLQMQALRLPTGGKPRIIACAEENESHLTLPRGCLGEIESLLLQLQIEAKIQDERSSGTPLLATFQGTLTAEQSTAARAMLAHDTGILSASTGFGKTVIAAWLIAKRRVNTLVLVHRRQLMEQWVDRLTAFLGLPPESIGRIGGGRKKRTGVLDVGLVQSLVRKREVDACIAEYGYIIVDECHHLAAQSFQQVVRKAQAKYVTGLSATVCRKDGHHPIVLMQCGPVRFHVDAQRQAAIRSFRHTVWVRPTGFRPLRVPAEDLRVEFQELFSELVADETRNHQICEDVVASVAAGRSPLILTERNEHLDALFAQLSGRIPQMLVLRGGMSLAEVRTVTSRLRQIHPDEPRVILATGRYIGEGFDDARLDTLFLCLPISWHGTIAQYVGRLHRSHRQKREVQVYDYADLQVPMFARMFDRRCQGYEAIGYQILLPGHAIAGWPEKVPLPVDPQWKRDYAVTVSRLIRDGVEIPLATLFADATVENLADNEEVTGARSATEAFLFGRLETLSQTQGRFRLNTKLPIPFDLNGQMEVDFLCADARVVVEVDGRQHLETLDAYRRDRRKDRLLQENGYFVLRFLTEDIQKNLDEVLDTLLRTLASRATDTGSFDLAGDSLPAVVHPFQPQASAGGLGFIQPGEKFQQGIECSVTE